MRSIKSRKIERPLRSVPCIIQLLITESYGYNLPEDGQFFA